MRSSDIMTEVANDTTVSEQNDKKQDDFCVERLITEVRRRPDLYYKSYAVEKVTKQRLWTDICQAMFQNWNDLDLKKKNEKARAIQNKWRDLKHAFAKQYAEQDQLTPSEKRRKYQYYDTLTFLIPAITENQSRLDNNNEPKDKGEETVSYVQKQTENMPPTTTFDNVPQPEACAFPQIENSELPQISASDLSEIGGTELDTRDCGLANIGPSGYQGNQIGVSEMRQMSSVLPPIKVKELAQIIPQVPEPPEYIPLPAAIRDIDENYHFCLSLVPGMRRFNEDQRFFARMEILRIMRQISTMGSEKISLCNTELLKYSYGEGSGGGFPSTSTAPDPGTVPMPTINDEAYPGLKRTETGEIEYPETDPEDYDI